MCFRVQSHSHLTCFRQPCFCSLLDILTLLDISVLNTQPRSLTYHAASVSLIDAIYRIAYYCCSRVAYKNMHLSRRGHEKTLRSFEGGARVVDEHQLSTFLTSGKEDESSLPAVQRCSWPTLRPVFFCLFIPLSDGPWRQTLQTG